MIKRWSTGVGDTVAQRPEGEYVLFTDHESARKEWEVKEKEYAAREKRLRELGNIWMVEQVEYPPEGAVAAAAVRLCARELCTILNEGDS